MYNPYDPLSPSPIINGGIKYPQLLVWISTHAIPIPFWYIDNDVKFQNPSWSGSAAPRSPFTDPKIQRIFKIYKGKNIHMRFLFFLFLNNFLANIGWMDVIEGVQTVV